jgi:hypothetical protein
LRTALATPPCWQADVAFYVATSATSTVIRDIRRRMSRLMSFGKPRHPRHLPMSADLADKSRRISRRMSADLGGCRRMSRVIRPDIRDIRRGDVGGRRAEGQAFERVPATQLRIGARMTGFA